MKRIKQKIILSYNDVINIFNSNITQLTSNEGFVRYFKNTGWLFIGKMSGMMVAFFVGAYVARYLGPDQFGLLSYVGSFVGLFSIFANLGIDNILSRELIKNPEKKDILLGSGFIIKIVGSIFSITLIAITLYIIKTDILTSILIFIYALTFIMNAFSVIDIYFQANVWAQKKVKIQIFSLLINNILKLIFIYYGFGLIWFISLGLVDGTIIIIGLILAYKKNGFSIYKWKFDYSIIVLLLKSSWPLIFSGIAVSIYMKIDQIMIKNMLGNIPNGIYSVAARLSELWSFIPGIICTSLFPAIANAKKVNSVLYQKRLLQLYSLMLYLSIFIIIFISIFAHFIIINLFGINYIEAVPVLKIHIWGAIAIFTGTAIYQYLIIENFNVIFLYTTLIGAILNILLNLILIPKIGITGAAIATVVSYSAQVFSIVFFKKTRKQIILLFKSLNIKNL